MDHHVDAKLVQSTSPHAQQMNSGNHIQPVNRQVQGGHSHVQGGHSHVQGGSRVVQGVSRVVQGGSRVVQGGHHHEGVRSSRVVQGGHSRVVQGGSRVVHQGEHSNIRTSHGQHRVSHHDHEGYVATGERRSVRRSQRRGEEHMVDSHVTHQGEGVVVDEHILKDQGKVRYSPRESHIISTTAGESRVIGSEIVSSHVVNTYDNVLESHRCEQQVRHTDVNKDVYYSHEQAHVNEIIKEVFIDIIVEKPVPRERFVDVPYDVFIERPVEHIIEKEVIVEKIVEKIYDKIIEIPIEKIVEYPIEKIIEKPVYIEEIFEVPVEIIIEEEVIYETEVIVYDDVTQEIDERDCERYQGCHFLPTIVNQTFEEVIVEVPRYVDNIIEQTVESHYDNIIECEKIIEQEVEHKYTVEYPVWHDRVTVVEKHVDRPYDVYVDVEHHIDQPIYVDNIIQRDVPVAVRKEKIIEREVVNVVRRPYEVEYETHQDVWYDREVIKENIIETPVYYENVIRRPYYTENVVECPVEKKVYNYYDVIREVEVPVEKVIRECIEREYEVAIENVIDQRIEHPVERIVEHRVPVENIVYVDKIIEQIVEHKYDNIIEEVIHQDNVIEEEVMYEVEVIVPVEHIVEKIIEHKREFTTKVEVDVEVRREVYVDRIIEREVVVENKIEKPIYVNRTVDTDLDSELTHACGLYRDEYESLSIRKSELEELLRSLTIELNGCGIETDYYCEISKLRKKIIAMEMELSMLRNRKDHRGGKKEKHIHVTYIPCPEASAINMQIQDWKSRNQAIRQKIEFQNTRTQFGKSNYVFEETVVEGRKVRAVRKSNRNTQNQGVTVTNANENHHLISRVENKLETSHHSD